MVEQIDRPGLKAEVKTLLQDAQVNPRMFTALYLLLTLLLTTVDSAVQSVGTSGLGGPVGLFVSILTRLLAQVLAVGFFLYCMTVRQRRSAEYLTLFDGFSFAGKVVGLAVIQYFFICLWSLLFVVPGIVAAYRYRFAYYNLCENPELGCMDALDLSKRQTSGYKAQLFMLDLSYIGWALLASLPSAGWTGYVLSLRHPFDALSSVTTGAYALPVPLSLGVDFLCGLWMVAVAVFYLPTFQCVELEYFETAKRTSGVSPAAFPLDENAGGLF